MSTYTPVNITPFSIRRAEAMRLMAAADRLNGRRHLGSVPVFARRHAR